MDNLLSTLENNGYVETETTEREFLWIANHLGKPIASRMYKTILDNLQPRQEQNAHPKSLSKLYGIGEFPFHTDGAYFCSPPKYIMLRYIQGVENPTPTKVLCLLDNLQTKEIENLQRDFWMVRGRHLNFYSSLVFKNVRTSELILRYDTGCMKSVSRNGYFETIVKEQTSRNLTLHIQWHKGKTLIINNWRLLHSRPSVMPEEANFRTLQRIMVNE